MVRYRLQSVAPDGNENIFNIIDNFCNEYVMPDLQEDDPIPLMPVLEDIPLMPDLLEATEPTDLVTM